MNSIRPLITITVLVVVGAFLYVKINQGPVRPATGPSDGWSQQEPSDAPPLAASPNTLSSQSGAPPSWPAAAPAVEVPQSPAVTAGASAALQPAAVVPPIPEMPEVIPQSQPAPPIVAAAPAPAELPATIPTAQYPGDSAPLEAAVVPQVAADAPTSITPQVAEPIAQLAPVAEQPAAPAVPMTPEEANQADVAATNLESPPLTTEQNPLRQAPPPTDIGRYATSPATTEQSRALPPSTADRPSFATTWPSIQQMLQQGELAQAHELLSQWHNDPALTPVDAELVDTLLSQLAGTVIYSDEHQLEPAHQVKPGETLETIAQQYQVPWQLLAKINGIEANGQIQPGQDLKVVRGPFSAVIDTGRKQLTLRIGNRYAGKFPVTIPSMNAVSDGQWVVEEKMVVPATDVTQSSYTPGSASVDRAIVLRGSQTPDGTSGPPTLTISSNGQPIGTGAPAAIQVTPQDAEELSDILSIGSRVEIQR